MDCVIILAHDDIALDVDGQENLSRLVAEVAGTTPETTWIFVSLWGDRTALWLGDMPLGSVPLATILHTNELSDDERKQIAAIVKEHLRLSTASSAKTPLGVIFQKIEGVY